MLSADKPIVSINEDLLNRTQFSQAIASIIREWKKKESLVIALYGQWGSGKSSLKNMIVDILKKNNDNCPYTIEFNPWQCSNSELLSIAFFREIDIVLNTIAESKQTSKDDKEAAKKRAEKWKMYSSICSVASVGLKVVGTIIPGFSLAGDIADKASVVAKSGSDALTAQGAVGKSLTEIKKELDDDLCKLDKPILIVIDDVDRLSADEITLLFQLIKANGDFHNLIYLVLCQRSIVEKALEKLAPGAGREFLEKIIQVPFDIPIPSRKHIRDEIFNKLKSLGHSFNNIQIEDALDELYEQSIKYYFETMRDVRRFLNTLSIHVILLTKNEYLEVNTIDLIALEVLRVFEQGVYERLPVIKDTLVLSMASINNQNISSKEHLSQIIDSVVKCASKDNIMEVSKILQYLFPHLDFQANWTAKTISLKDAKSHRRVCHPDYFDRYFQLYIPNDDIRVTYLDRLLLPSLSNSDSTNDISTALEEFYQNDQFFAILIDLQPRLRNKFNNRSLVVNILDFADRKFKEAFIFLEGKDAELVKLMLNVVEPTRYEDRTAFLSEHKLDEALKLLEDVSTFIINCCLSNKDLIAICEQTKAIILIYHIIEKTQNISTKEYELTNELRTIFFNKLNSSTPNDLMLNPLMAKYLEYSFECFTQQGFLEKFTDQLYLTKFLTVIYTFNQGKAIFNRLKETADKTKLSNSCRTIESHIFPQYLQPWRKFIS